MKLKISTYIPACLPDVKKGFDQSLFQRLSPPFPRVSVDRFDGCEKGHIVSLNLSFILFHQQWISEIVKEEEKPKLWMFVDEGRVLPFFLKYWKHSHIVKEGLQGCAIIDDVHYSTGTMLTDLLAWPLLYLQFLYRKPVYRRYFRQLLGG